MKKELHSATSLPLSPVEERKNRMVKYTVAMIIRVVCIFAMLFVEGWWLLVAAIGAIFLPYFAVILANTQIVSQRRVAERPATIVLRNEQNHQ